MGGGIVGGKQGCWWGLGEFGGIRGVSEVWRNCGGWQDWRGFLILPGKEQRTEKVKSVTREEKELCCCHCFREATLKQIIA